MRRIRFLVPDVPMAKRIVDELLLVRIEERHLHVLAKRGTQMEDLPEASLLQKSNFYTELYSAPLRRLVSEQIGVPERLIHIIAGSELILREIFERFGAGAAPVSSDQIG